MTKNETPDAPPTLSPPHRAVFPLSKKGYKAVLFRSMHDAAKAWENVAPAHDLFLQSSYLCAVEECPPAGMRFSYILFYKEETPVGLAYCQISPFSVGRSIQSTEEGKDKFPCVLRAFGQMVKNMIVGKNHNLLVCGNLLLTGEHGYHFHESLDKGDAFSMLEEALVLAQREWETRKVNIDGIFIKDLAPADREAGKLFTHRKFREFTFHPNMLLELPRGRNTFEDYLAAITSKYRVRAKRAFRLAEGIEKTELTETQIINNQHRLYELYKNVMDNQDFNMVTLHEGYFPALRRHLGVRFRVFGYYLEGEMIGFFTTIENGAELEAHFLGFDQTCNRNCQVYLNMLFDILRIGIELRSERIVYARTAMEIKSSIGAEPLDMFCYIRASNRLTNKILPPVLEYLRPPDDWEPRSPFKD